MAPTRGLTGHLAIAVVVIATGAAVIATVLGADRARARFDPVEVGRRIFVRMLEHGVDDAEVRSAMFDLRARVGERPLDARARALYAELLLELSGGGDASAACFHAGSAASLNPVTVPVIRYSSHVLFRCGKRTEALALTREMFDYDPDSAARLLSSLTPFLPRPILLGDHQEAIPDNPDAWLAWSREITRAGRQPEGESWLVAAHERWPDHVLTLRTLAQRATDSNDWDELARLLPLDRKLPETGAWAHLWALRGRLRAETGDVSGAVRDVTMAMALSSQGTTVLLTVGDTLAAAGEADEARRVWHQALFHLSGDQGATRRAIRVRLARLEDATGKPANALRAWRAVLEEDPDHREARRRIHELTGANL